MDIFEKEKGKGNANEFADLIIKNYKLDMELKDSVDLENAKQELIQTYKKYHHQLDKKHMSELRNADNDEEPTKKAGSLLWEILMVRDLKNVPNIEIKHKDSDPDWRIKLENNKEYYIEATAVRTSAFLKMGMSGTAEMELMLNEFKTKVTGAILTKAQDDGEKLGHENLVKKEKIGYILAINILNNMNAEAGAWISEIVKACLPLGYSKITLSNGKIIGNPSFTPKDKFEKPSTKATINSDILTNKDYKWISALLISVLDPIYHFEFSKKFSGFAGWEEKKNSYVLIHHDLPTHPLTDDIFDAATQIKPDPDNNIMIVEGKNIFPIFAPSFDAR
jgi:hypothetical protein